MQVGDIGRPVSYPTYPIKSVQVLGTFGTGNVVIQVSNMPSSPTYTGVRDPWGSALNFNDAGLKELEENTYWVRPKIENGDSTTDVDVYLLCVTER